MSRPCLLLFFLILSVSADWINELENKFKKVELACEEDSTSCDEEVLNMAVYMEKMQELMLTYEKSTPVILDYLSKHEVAVESLQNIQNSGHAKEFRHHQLDLLHELHNMATDLLKKISDQEQQHWLAHLKNPFP